MAIRSSVGIEWQACHMAEERAFSLCWPQAGGLRHTTAFSWLIANENERLALSSSSHPCSSVLSSFLKESAAMPNTSHSSAIPAGLWAASSSPHLTWWPNRSNRGRQPWSPAALGSSGFPLPHSARPAAFPARRAPALSWAGTDSSPLILSNAVSYHRCI